MTPSVGRRWLGDSRSPTCSTLEHRTASHCRKGMYPRGQGRASMHEGTKTALPHGGIWHPSSRRVAALGSRPAGLAAHRLVNGTHRKGSAGSQSLHKSRTRPSALARGDMGLRTVDSCEMLGVQSPMVAGPAPCRDLKPSASSWLGCASAGACRARGKRCVRCQDGRLTCVALRFPFCPCSSTRCGRACSGTQASSGSS